MSDDRKKPLWPWIAALLIGLPVLYVALFGPACWAASRGANQNDFFDAVYWPIGWSMWHGGTSARQTLAWFAEFGMPAGARWYLRSQATHAPDADSFVLTGHSRI